MPFRSFLHRLPAAAATALIAGLGVGFLVGFSQARPQPSEDFLLTECPTGGSFELLKVRITIGTRGNTAVVAVSATARIVEPGPAWLSRDGVEALGHCLFANGVTSETPDTATHIGGPQLPVAGYGLDPDSRTLSVTFRETPIAVDLSPNSESSMTPSPLDTRDRLVHPAVVVTQLERMLHVDIAVCRSRIARLACAGDIPTQVTMEVSDAIRNRHEPVRAEPVPGAVASETSQKTTTSTWEVTDPTARITVSVPLRPQYLWASRSITKSIDHDVSLGPFSLTQCLRNVTEHASSLIAFVAGAWVLRRAGGVGAVPHGLGGMALGYVALLIGLAPRAPGYSHAVDTLLSAAMWAVVFVIAGISVHRLSAVAGVLLAYIGAFVHKVDPSLTGLLVLASALGLLLTSSAAVIAVGARLHGCLSVFPVSAVPLPYGRLGQRMPLLYRLVRGGALIGLTASVAILIGDSVGRTIWQLGSDGMGVVSAFRLVVDLISSNIGLVLLFTATPLLVLAAIAARFSGPVPSLHPVLPGRTVASGLAFLIAVVAPPPELQLAGIVLPTWPITWFLLSRLLTRTPIAPAEAGSADMHLLVAVAAEQSRAKLLKTDTQVSAGKEAVSTWSTQQEEHRRTFQRDVARDALAWGPTRTWLGNARCAAWAGAVIALIPVGYHLWGVIETLPARLGFNQFLFMLIRALNEWARWVGTAFGFGALYVWLRPRTGAMKGVLLALVWSLGALLTELIRRWLGIPVSGVWLYLSLQMFLFFVALGIACDLMTINAAGHSWRRLGDLYRVTTWRQRVAYACTLVFAVIGLVDQVRSGAGIEVAKQLFVTLSAGLG